MYDVYQHTVPRLLSRHGQAGARGGHAYPRWVPCGAEARLTLWSATAGPQAVTEQAEGGCRSWKRDQESPRVEARASWVLCPRGVCDPAAPWTPPGDPSQLALRWKALDATLGQHIFLGDSSNTGGAASPSPTAQPSSMPRPSHGGGDSRAPPGWVGNQPSQAGPRGPQQPQAGHCKLSRTNTSTPHATEGRSCGSPRLRARLLLPKPYCSRRLHGWKGNSSLGGKQRLSSPC